MERPIDTAETALTALVDLFHEVGASDQRPRAPRYRMQVPVRYRWEDRDEWFSGLTRNVSRSGILFSPDSADPHIVSERSPRPGTRLSITMEVPHAPAGERRPQMRADAMVVRATAGSDPDQSVGVTVEHWRSAG